MEQNEVIAKIIEHDKLLALQSESINTLIKTQDQQGKLLDTVHKMNEVQVEILTEMKYLRSDLCKVEKNQDVFKEDVSEMFDEIDQTINSEICGIKGEIKGVTDDVNEIKGKPAKRFEKIVDKLIDMAIGGAVGAILFWIANNH